MFLEDNLLQGGPSDAWQARRREGVDRGARPGSRRPEHTGVLPGPLKNFVLSYHHLPGPLKSCRILSRIGGLW